MGAWGLDYTAVRCWYHSANSPSAHVGNLNNDHRKLRVCFTVFYYIIIALRIPITYSIKNNTIQISFYRPVGPITSQIYWQWCNKY